MQLTLVLVGLVSLTAAYSPSLYPASSTFLGTLDDVEDIFANSTLVNNTEAIQFKCQYMDGLDFYDIQPLAIVAEKNGGYFNYTDATLGATMLVSFCGTLPPAQYCGPQEPTMAVLHHPIQGCVRLSGSNPTDNAQLKQIGKSSEDVGVNIQYSGGNPSYNLSIEIYCDKVDFQSINATYVEADGQTKITYRFKSRVGCKYD